MKDPSSEHGAGSSRGFKETKSQFEGKTPIKKKDLKYRLNKLREMEARNDIVPWAEKEYDISDDDHSMLS